jgi:hypothetical protein
VYSLFPPLELHVRVTGLEVKECTYNDNSYVRHSFKEDLWKLDL